MNLRAVRPCVFLTIGLVAPLCGCAQDDGLPRQEASGTVTLDGQPLASGTIQFQPAGNSQGAVVSGGAAITDGQYRIARETGLVPGTYKVLIVSHVEEKKADASSAPGAQTRPPPELIPARYNSATELTAEIKKAEPNVFNFEIKKK
jgi:hypothetical protein